MYEALAALEEIVAPPAALGCLQRLLQDKTAPSFVLAAPPKLNDDWHLNRRKNHEHVCVWERERELRGRLKKIM